MKRTILAALLVMASAGLKADNTVRFTRVSVHDPSVVWNPETETYYIFGSHRASARTKNLTQWTAFQAPWGTQTSANAANNRAFTTNLTTTVTVGGEEVAFGNFDVHAWSGAYGEGWNINGNMWAPDVIWNTAMEKWCMYLSINGPHWNSSIILLTADDIQGPYYYQGPVVFSGFYETGSKVSWKDTDLSLVLGADVTSLPARYNHGNTNDGNTWGDYWPHAIDPCVFYDEDGRLLMTYGSWSGGIWLLELDEATGLRDYDTSYGSDASQGKAVTHDPYFGKKLAGGCYVSGEASYVEHIGNYYYLFVTYGGLEQTGGYQMRVFRSEQADGPYTDVRGNSAIFTTWALNYGPNSTNRGENIFGAYGEWGPVVNGERSQGHNSIIAAPDGRTYLVYHTRFQNGIDGNNEAHQVRVHQVFVSENGWLVAAPFEYTGEQATDEDIASHEMFTADEIAGDYKFMVHRYGLDHANKEQVTPVNIHLSPEGTISGDRTGKWEVTPGTSYIAITINSVVYRGVLLVQTLGTTGKQALCFTGCNTQGANCWGYNEGYVPSGISDVTADKQVQRRGTFDLQGRRVTPTRPGIYIQDGQKRVVR